MWILCDVISYLNPRNPILENFLLIRIWNPLLVFNWYVWWSTLFAPILHPLLYPCPLSYNFASSPTLGRGYFPASFLCVWPSDVLWLMHGTNNDSLMFLSLALSLLPVCHCYRRGWVAVLSSCLPLNLGPRISTSGRNQTPIYNKEPSSVGSATWAELSNILQVRWADPQVAHRHSRSIYCCMPLRFGSSLLRNNRWLIYTLSFRKKAFFSTKLEIILKITVADDMILYIFIFLNISGI